MKIITLLTFCNRMALNSNKMTQIVTKINHFATYCRINQTEIRLFMHIAYMKDMQPGFIQSIIS